MTLLEKDIKNTLPYLTESSSLSELDLEEADDRELRLFPFLETDFSEVSLSEPLSELNTSEA